MKSSKPQPISTTHHHQLFFSASPTESPYPAPDAALPYSPLSPTSPTSPAMCGSPSRAASSRSFSFPFPLTLSRRASTNEFRLLPSRSKPQMTLPPTSTTSPSVPPQSPSANSSLPEDDARSRHPGLQRTQTDPIFSSSSSTLFNNTPPTSPTATFSSPIRSPNSLRKKTTNKRTVGTISHCGRHGNDWLFGGYSVRQTVRGFLRED